MVFNTLQNLRPWAKSEKKNFLDLPLDVGQMLGFSLKKIAHVVDSESGVTQHSIPPPPQHRRQC